ncbi:MAG: GlcNAc-PI de-N-acetylase, partial [Gammaproteobacteria bacterium]|nr:GlcNAc-PI de-N-acetylase [Gammaproteobacteria bacterium]
EFRPDVVLTFDPIGGYRHPDHIAIHNATVAAFDKAADPNYDDPLPPHQADKLYFHTISKTFLKFSVFMLKLTGKDPSKWGKN